MTTSFSKPLKPETMDQVGSLGAGRRFGRVGRWRGVGIRKGGASLKFLINETATTGWIGAADARSCALLLSGRASDWLRLRSRLAGLRPARVLWRRLWVAETHSNRNGSERGDVVHG